MRVAGQFVYSRIVMTVIATTWSGIVIFTEQPARSCHRGRHGHGETS